MVEACRPSSYFVPVPAPRKNGKQLVLDTQWTGIADEGFDGLLYRSALVPGWNVMLFDLEAATPRNGQVLRMRSVAYEAPAEGCELRFIRPREP